jgi:para-nitrobenzyl esterase
MRKLKIFIMALGILAICLFALKACDTPELSPIDTPQGPIIGELSDRNIHNFKAIPYATAPVGDLRFRAPEAPPSWTEARDALAFSPMCMQSTEASGDLLKVVVDGHGLSGFKRWLIMRIAGNMDAGEVSEDCLYANIRTPDPTGKRPVMVWVHGGGHQFGSGDFSIYQGDDLPARDVVVVTFNYRLNVFGYMAHPLLSAENPEGISGNYGLLDQIAALEWVQDNISAYGGDPGNVTLFGESAGASSIAALMASPQAEGLFDRAILQSGEATRTLNTLDDAEDLGEAIIAAVPEDTPLTAAKLRALPASSLLKAGSNGDYSGALRPIGDGVILPRSVPEILARGDFAPVPVMVGYNADEWALFYTSPDEALLNADINSDSPEAQLTALVAGYGEAAGRQIMKLYGFNGVDNIDAKAIAVTGDEYFGVSTRFILERSEALSAPAWAYTFTRVPPSSKQTLGAFHSAEMPFVFGTHEKALGLSDEDEALTDLMQAYWVNFATTGDPNGADLPAWPNYVDQNWMELTANTDRESGVIKDWREDKLDALSAGLDPRLSNEPTQPVHDVLDAANPYP